MADRRTKIGLHVLSEGEKTASDYMNQVPCAVMKFAQLDVNARKNTTLTQAVQLAKAKGCLVVGKRAEHNPNIEAPDMLVEARNYVNGIGADSFAAMVKTWPEIDVWEGPNEIDVKTPERMGKYAQLLAEFARIMREELGRAAGLGGWSVGCPEMDVWAYYAPALKAVQQYGAYLTRHSYGPLDYGPLDDPKANWYSFRHRRDQAEFDKLDFPKVPLIITEAGPDKLGGMTGRFHDIWGTDIFKFWREYVKPLEEGLEDYVVGLTIFTCGNGEANAFNSFDVAWLDVAGAALASPAVVPMAPAPVTPAPVAPYVDPTPAQAPVGWVPTSTSRAEQAFAGLYRWVVAHNGNPDGFRWPA